MKWIQATLTFWPDQVNMGRRGKFGAWRVHHCSEVGNPFKIRVDRDMIVGMLPGGVIKKLGRPVMRMMVARPYQRSALVNPVKLALEFEAAARRDRERIAALILQHRSDIEHDIIYFGSAAEWQR